MTLVPEGALTVSADGQRATLEMRDVPVVDQPRWPAHDTPTHAARMSFRIEWTAHDEPVRYEDPQRRFRLAGWAAETRLEAEVDVPALGFHWKSDPLATSRAAFGVIATEANGRFYAP